MSRRGSCNTVETNCIAPPARYPFHHTRRKCFRCGEHVCASCSTVQDYSKYGKQRICGRCNEEMVRMGSI